MAVEHLLRELADADAADAGVEAREAAVQRRLVLAGCRGTAAAVANSTCCSVIRTGVRGDASTGTGWLSASGGAPKGASN